MADTKTYLDQYGDGTPPGDTIIEKQLDEIMPLVGSILAHFNSIETDLDRQIAESVNDRAHQPGYSITAELNAVFAKKVSVFKALYGLAVNAIGDAQLATDFQSLWKSLYAVKDIRNDIAHADWLNANSDYVVRIRVGADENGPYSVTRSMPPSYLEAQLDSLVEVAEKLERFEESYSQALSR